MEIIVYALAAVGGLALLMVAGAVIASRQGGEPRHVDPDLPVEMPPLAAAPTEYDRRRRA